MPATAPLHPLAVPNGTIQRTRLINDALLAKPFVRLDDDRFPPGWAMRPHQHQFMQIIYIIAGRGVHRMADEQRFAAGDIIVVDHGQLHSWQAGRAWLELIDIGIDPQGLGGSALCHALSRCSRDLPGGILREALPLMPHVQAIRAAIRAGGPFTDLRLQGLLWQMLADIGRSACQQRRVQRTGEGADEQVEALETVIAAHFRRRLTLDDLAAAVHVSPKHLCRLVRRERATSPMRLLNTVRMQQAAALLADTQVSSLDLREVARAVGLLNRRHFSRLFQAAYGCSPSRFRAEALAH